jgi:hypothetical protein
METGAALNPVENRKPPGSLGKIVLALLMLGVLGTLAWFLVIKGESEVPAGDWVTYTGPDGDFSLRFPDQPQATESTQKSGNVVHMVTADMRTRTYSIAYSDYPQAAVDEIGAETLLDDGMNAGMKKISGLVSDSNKDKWNDHPAREFWADVPGGKAHYRIVLVGRRLYQLSIFHMASFEPNHEEFFGSFKLQG